MSLRNTLVISAAAWTIAITALHAKLNPDSIRGL